MIDLLGGVVLVWGFGVFILGSASAIAWWGTTGTWRDFFSTLGLVLLWPVWLAWTIGTAVRDTIWP